jgi:hypothetical protein
MRVALTTLHASVLALALGSSCALAAPPEQREREPQRSAQPAAPAQREQRAERANQPSPVPAARNDSRQFEPRQQDSRDARVDELRRQESSSHQNSDAFRRNGRLTADERKDLRRQINEAGQDIYPNTPRR